MQITLRQDEIEAALVSYICQQGIQTQGKQITVNFTAGRGAAGITAAVDIDPAGTEVPLMVPPSAEPILLAPTNMAEALPYAEEVLHEEKPKVGGLFN